LPRHGLFSRYDDGGYSGGSTDRPALQRLLADVKAGKIDVIVVYKVDRLTRSLADFAKLVELFDGQGVSFVSVTQQFNTTTSMGRLTLNVLLSFAQFETRIELKRARAIHRQLQWDARSLGGHSRRDVGPTAVNRGPIDVPDQVLKFAPQKEHSMLKRRRTEQ
jgi:DNA invertase Pin-like site-specific DNA recombinase